MNKRGAGQLYERVAWDKREPVDDGYGNSEGAFVEQFQCRAGFTYLRGGETMIAGRLQGKQPIVVRVRSSSSTRQIGPDWRMRDARKGSWTDSSETVWSGPTYAVRSIAATPDRMWLDVMVEEGVAA
jgi:head-tail adaptor